MNISRVTSDGRITIPAALRRALDLRGGDRLIFTLDGARLIVTPVHCRPLSELRGALPAMRLYTGVNDVREEVGQRLGADLLK